MRGGREAALRIEKGADTLESPSPQPSPPVLSPQGRGGNIEAGDSGSSVLARIAATVRQQAALDEGADIPDLLQAHLMLHRIAVPLH